jgi:hypothetical protein
MIIQRALLLVLTVVVAAVFLLVVRPRLAAPLRGLPAVPGLPVPR